MTEYFVSYAIKSEEYLLAYGCCIIQLEKFDLMNLKYELDKRANEGNIKGFSAIPLFITKVENLR